MFQEITPGIYQHFKGNKYEVLGVGTDTERTSVRYAIYKDVSTGEIWIRRIEKFLETVEVDGETKPRFEKL